MFNKNYLRLYGWISWKNIIKFLNVQILKTQYNIKLSTVFPLLLACMHKKNLSDFNSHQANILKY